MPIRTEPVEYAFGDLVLEGLCAYDDSAPPRPGVLVVHTALGPGRFEAERAVALAEMGYVGFVADLYGRDAHYENDEEAIVFARSLVRLAGAFDGRMAASMAALRAHPAVDPARTAALGFCLGGRAVLNLARLDDPVAGVISFHGGLMPHPEKKAVAPMPARVLICHGWHDVYDPPAHIMAVGEELTEAGADWQIHAYGAAGHGFTDPYKTPKGEFHRYIELVARRSWQATGNFLAELFPPAG
ncbi:dienelactone hydrolase family protein [Novosphingobium bradum]|uniref:Dienelactone hydrolase family protein n=1 Tax=Novosphingobium bradum TaxID=1737444 RepID=A0ABV7IQ54_9SPHN